MRVAFLITAYRDPMQLARLTQRLFVQSPTDLRHVQFDCSAPAPPQPLAPDTAVSATRSPISWGDGTYLTAIVDSLRDLLAQPWDWTVVLSGQDLPVRPLSELHQLLDATTVAAFAPSDIRANSWDDANEELRRRYWYQYRWLREPWHQTLNRPLAMLWTPTRALTGQRLLVRTRPRGAPPGVGSRARITPFSASRQCHFGTDYVAIRREMVVALLRFIDDNTDIWRYFRRCYIPSEVFFASVLRWLEPEGVANLGLHYMQFGGHAHPRRLTPDDLPAITDSGAFFARKFEDADDWVDELICLDPRSER